MAQKRKLSRQETEQALPLLREFNKLSKAFIGLLSQKVEHKRQRVNTLSVMVTGMKIPTENRSTFSINTIDINRSIFYKKNRAKNSITDPFSRWEDDFKNKRRGVIL